MTNVNIVLAIMFVCLMFIRFGQHSCYILLLELPIAIALLIRAVNRERNITLIVFLALLWHPRLMLESRVVMAR